jgi:hypothetical protein
VFPRAGVTQLVECDLAKVDVAGSNPVSRSILPFQNRLWLYANNGGRPQLQTGHIGPE